MPPVRGLRIISYKLNSFNRTRRRLPRNTMSERKRRTADELHAYHLQEALKNMPLDEKVALIRRLKEDVKTELEARKAAAESATKLMEGL